MRLTDDADAAQAAGDVNAAAELYRQARGHYLEAVRLRPDYSEAHNNLGQLYIRFQDLRRAGEQFALAVKINPDNVAARFNLAVAQVQIGATRHAADNLRRVLANWPNYAPALVSLARILAADPDPALRGGQDALALAQKACELTSADAPLAVDCIDTLGMAYAELGQFDTAIDVALWAAAIADKRGRGDLAEKIQARVAGYRQGRAARLTPLYPPPSTSPATQTTSASAAVGH
jgi:tetratricopeptide (TPR) repeat protein